MDIQDMGARIKALKDQHNAVILAHNYQLPEIQDIADYLGDSLELAKKATQVKAEYIVFCGVDFMAESAQILNQDKTVLIPDSQATCPMANMVDVGGLRRLKEKLPEAKTVAYINTTAAIKAESDICCTSANALNVIKHLEEKQIIFVPDINLGSYVQNKLPDKEMIIWQGYCSVHHEMDFEEIRTLQRQYPDAELLVHPECPKAIIDVSDHVFSTNGMVNHVKASPTDRFIIGTEKEMCYRLLKEAPDKKFYPVTSAICHDMKKITLEKVLKTLEDLSPAIELSPEIIQQAKEPLERMMNIGRGD